MPFAYVTEPGAVVRRRGRTLLIEKHGQRLAEWELVRLQALILVGGVQLTTPAIKALLQAGVETAFVSARGKLIGQLTPPKSGNVALRLAQYALAHRPEQRLELARRVVQEKIAAMAEVLQRYADNYPELPLDQPRRRLRRAARTTAAALGLATLRGIEGAAAACYWKAFTLLNRSPLKFEGRKARPPADPINALLSLGYVLLVNEIWSTLDAMGFDPFLGFYHDLRPNRPSLALDLVEPFRHRLIDRMVLRSVNLGRFQADDFHTGSKGGVLLNRRAWKTFVADYERTLQALAADPKDGKQRSWREIIRRNCEHLAHTLLPPASSHSRRQSPGCFDPAELEAGHESQ